MKTTLFLHKTAAAVLLSAVTIAGLSAKTDLQAAYYESKTTETISKGTVLESSRQIVDGGLRDVYVLKVPMNDEYLNLDVFSSKKEYGLKETTLNLVSSGGGIAGVNGDFFGMNGDYSIPLGTELKHGGYSTTDSFNSDKMTGATFFLANDGNPFINYMNTRTAFLNDGAENIDVGSVNKVASLEYPSVLTSEVFANTADIDKRHGGAVKLVCEDGKITYISLKGEVCNVPKNGFVIIMSEKFFEENKDKFALDQKAELVFNSSINFNDVKLALSGGGKILDNGLVSPNSGGVPTPNERQPRTAIGINQAGDTVILMAVDGRTHSIGATNSEMAQLMLDNGAYNAMHLDGGGSTTLVSKVDGKDGINVINAPSGGSQRKVINAIGITENAPTGSLDSIEVFADKEVMTVNANVTIKIFGYDAYHHKVETPAENASTKSTKKGKFSVSGGNIIYTPQEQGEANLTVSYSGISSKIRVRAVKISEITANTSKISANTGSPQALSFGGKSADGYSFDINPSDLKFEVYPPDLGYVSEGSFYTKKSLPGWIRVIYDDLSYYIQVMANAEPVLLDSLDAETQINFSSYPGTVTGHAVYSPAQKVIGDASIELAYNFLSSADTQAAYIDINNTDYAKNEVSGYKLFVFGDNSGHWLRGRVVDADGIQHTIDFSRKIDFTGWEELTASLPNGLSYPVTLDRIYVASVDEANGGPHTLYFDGLSAILPKAAGMPLPVSSRAKDKLYTDNIKSGQGTIISFAGNFGGFDGEQPQGYAEIRSRAISSLTSNSSAAVYGGSSDISSETGIPTYSHGGGYQAYPLGDALVVKMFALNGGFSLTSPDQWAMFTKDIRSDYNNIIIQTDLSPLDFKYHQETEMFNDILHQVSSEGKNIFVVSNYGSDVYSGMREGIRYINLGRMYNGDSVNHDFSVLRFIVDGKNISYNIEKIFE